jgi:hypothetical protein
MKERIAPSERQAQELRALVHGQLDAQSGEELLSTLVRLSTERVLQEALVRQAKLGASCQVEVLAEEGLTNHSYRVLQLWRRQRCKAEQDS